MTCPTGETCTSGSNFSTGAKAGVGVGAGIGGLGLILMMFWLVQRSRYKKSISPKFTPVIPFQSTREAIPVQYVTELGVDQQKSELDSKAQVELDARPTEGKQTGSGT